MKARNILWVVAAASLATLIGVSVVTAAAYTDDALYYIDVDIENTGAAATNVAVPFPLSTAELIDGDYIYASCNNTAILTETGADANYMPATANTTGWIVFVPSIATGRITYTVYLGGPSDMNAPIRYFPASAGANVTDHATMELGDDFWIEVKGFVLTSLGASKYVVNKAGAFALIVGTGAGGNVTAAIPLGGGTVYVSALGVLPGEHTIEVSANITTVRLYVDTVLVDSAPLTANVTDNANIWELFVNDSMLYVESIKFWVR